MRDRIGLALAACALLSCATPVPGGCSGEVANLDGAPRRLHVRVLLTRDGRPERHEVVVHVQPGQIEAIGLTPMGTQAWRLRHDHDGVDVENRIGRHLGLSPRLAYDAIAHAGLAAGAGPIAAPVELAREACGYTARIVRIADDAGPERATERLTPTPPAPPEPRRP